MTAEQRKIYTKTFNYKMIFILSGFRSIFRDHGVGIVEAIKKLKEKDDSSYESFNQCFLTLVDYGYIPLNDEEVKAYFDYIFDLTDFPVNSKERVFSNLKFFAEQLRFEKDVEEMNGAERGKQQAYAIVNLYESIK